MGHLKRIGDYDLIEQVGAGGMGLVFKAVHRKLGRPVALKVIRGRYIDSPQHLERFKREAAVCSRLKHPNVVELYDFGEEDEAIYYAMEFIDAPTLDDVIEDEGPLPSRTLYPIFTQLASALAYIHEQGVIHRDLKPSNVMVSSQGHVTLMDFGLVKQDEATVLTQDGKAIGTPRYMSPEMLQAKPVDQRSDIFQFGLVLYEAATDSKPFKGKDVYSIAAAVLSQTPPKPSSRSRKLNRSFDTLVLNCLEKLPENRYQDANELLADLERCRKNIPINSTNKASYDQTEEEMDAVSPSDSANTISLTRVTGLGLSTISGSVVKIGNELSIRHLLLGIFIAISCLCGSIYLINTSPKTYTSLKVQVLPDVGGATVEWSSKVPYKSRLRYWRKEVDEIDKALSVESEEETTGHSLFIPGLELKVPYSFIIDYPNGSSMHYPLEPLQFSQLRVLDFQIVSLSLTKVLVKVKSNLPCSASMSFECDGKTRSLCLSQSLQLSHEKQVTDLTAGKPLEKIVLSLKSMRSRKKIPLGRFGGLEHIVKRASELKKNTSYDSVLPELERMYKGDMSQDERTALEPNMRRLLGPIKSWHKFLENRSLYRDIFSHHSPEFRDVHDELYEIVRCFEHVDAQLNQVKAGVDFSIDEIYRPYISISHSKERRPGSCLTIFSLKEKDSTFSPAEQYHKSRAASGLLQLYRSHEEFKSRREYVKNIDLTSFLSTCSDRPVLIARVRNFEPAYYMRITINDDHHIDLRNTEKSLPPVLFLFDRAVRDVEDEMYLKSMNYIAATFPRRLLRNGKNRFRIVLHVIPTFKTVNLLQLRELRLFAN